MAEFEQEDGMTRDDLVQRVALMEEMIAEGRRSTICFGWIFVLWGLIESDADRLAVSGAAFTVGEDMELADCYRLWRGDSVHRNGDTAPQKWCCL